ncbi:MAG: threonine/serine exporter family protein [Clostridia bacterium]|nr:threonine/serine exporter family protein [Clostridia bacterium]
MNDLLLAFFGSLLPAILFNADAKRLFWIGLSGAVGWLIFINISEMIHQVVFPTFLGAFSVGIYSESMARLVKSPATVFSVSGAFPLVPGIGAYTTVQLLVQNKLQEAAGKALETISSAGAIALGIMAASAIFRIAKKIRQGSTDYQR